LETLASAQAVVRRYKELSKEAQLLSLDEVEKRLEAGDSIARQVVLEAGCSLGEFIGFLSATLNIQEIILTGDMTRFGEPWLNAVRQAMLQSALERLTQNTQLEVGTLDYRACILGAAAHFLMDGYALLFRQAES
jgi:predicted NBD/HSP70 family sugar kinase